MNEYQQTAAEVRSVSTDDVKKEEKAEFWADMVCRHLIQVNCDPMTSNEQFHGSIHSRTIAHVDVSQVATVAQKVHRTKQLIAQANEEYFLLNIQREGCSMLQQDGRTAQLAVGDMALYSSVRAYRLAFDADFLQTVVVIPAAPLRAMCPNIDALTAIVQRRDNPLVNLLTAVANSYFGTPFEQLPHQATVHAANALTEIVAGCVLNFQGNTTHASSNLTLFHLARIKKYVLAHLGDIELSVSKVAAVLNLSPAHIHRLFETEPTTFSTWIWDCRLAACRRELCQQSQAHQSIGEITYNNGFGNASHFSRMFRARFGMTARDWRAQPRMLDMAAGEPNGRPVREKRKS